ncbi:MAG: Uma2 family endonuclease [bacterium]|nr:Uma2 family endonuclease [bacterium]
MLQTQPGTMTAEDFDAFALLPENQNRILEFIAGEIHDVPSNAYVSSISTTISYFFKRHVLEIGLAAHITGEAGGYMVNGERYAPDVAVLLKAKQPELAKDGYNPLPPDLAVEVDYPSSPASKRALRLKLGNYAAAGTLLWVVDPETKVIEVYPPVGKPKVFALGQTLDGGDVLPGFTLKVDDIFQ